MMSSDQQNLPTVEASLVLGLAPNTLRSWARGRTDRGTKRPARFLEGTHFFKRSSAPNAPLIWRIAACREFLDSLGYVLPPLQATSSEEGQD